MERICANYIKTKTIQRLCRVCVFNKDIKSQLKQSNSGAETLCSSHQFYCVNSHETTESSYKEFIPIDHYFED